ncbi:hypothetical protein MACH07_21870 [Flagellimonas marinaquae]|uniref:YD repeat-containing protein n=1 Tax=Flagellimonas marinaquae TaxID=254955 RepID=A0AA48HDS3_9FLAO|nr:hypothetical protein MACH07_21870 [Allomuricauda aquimarina]
MKKLIILIFISSLGYSQEVTNLGILPSTPEAANFEKYGNIPVGKFSGIPQISIPIYTIRLKNLEVPINLSYHSSGVKVDETASSVGLGWVLTASGMISCNTRGNPDFDTYGYANEGNQSQHIYDRFVVGAFQEETINNIVQQDNDHDLLDDIAAGLIDGEPDLFHYSFPGNSGKFVYDETITPRTIPFRPLLIEKNNVSDNYKITDEKGNIFEFSERESSEIKRAVGSDCDVINPLYTSVPITPTWHLTKITTPQNETITFTYESVSYAYEYIASQHDYILETDDRNVPPAGCLQKPSLECRNRIEVNGKRLSKIISSNGTEIQVFYDSQDRLDLPGTNRISRIDLSFNSELIDFWILDHDYFTSNCNPPQDESCYRLKLNQITRNGHPPYQFYYDQTKSLPRRNSFSQDHWGYYNGKNNSTFLPAVHYRGQIVPGANREPDFEYSRAGVLNKIIYPTGGETIFEYEPNQYWFDDIEPDNSINQSQILSIDGLATGVPISTQFTINGTENVYGTFKFACVNGSYCENASNVPQGDLMVARLTGNGIDIAYDYPYNPSPFGTDTPLVLPPGTYTMTLYATVDDFYGTFMVEWVEVTETRVQENRIGSGLRIAKIIDRPNEGKDLVREFDYSDPNNTSKSSGFISHNQQYTSLLQLRWLEPIPPNAIRENYCNYFTRSSHNLANVSSVNGGYVGYEYVTELYGVAGEHGKTVSRYTTNPDVGDNVLKWPFVPPTSYDWIRGLIKEEVVYRKEEGTIDEFFKTNETFYHYDIKHGFNNVLENQPNENNILGLKIATIRPYYNNGGLYTEWSILDVGAYWTVASWYTMVRKEEKWYGSDGSNLALTTNRHFFYDNPVHAQITREETYNSIGNLLRKKMTYPDDITSVSSLGNIPITSEQLSAIDSLKTNAEHRIAEPVQIEHIKDDKSTLERINYKIWPGQDIILPEYSESSKEGNDFEREIVYHQYDDIGNPIEIYKANGIHIVYVWGYNRKYPVAKIENVTYGSGLSNSLTTTQQAYIDSIVLASNQDDDRTRDIKNDNSSISYIGNEGNLRQALAELRNSLPNSALMTSYTYDPLIGVTSITNPRGYTVYYEYDQFNRLKEVRDADNNIVSDYKYHYQGQ